MNAIQDLALLFAIAVPVLLIVGINLFLTLGGERGTLLLPSARRSAQRRRVRRHHAAADDALEREAA